jgi:predicted transcriptional regulator
MIELDDNIEALEVCIRNGTPSYSVRLSSKNMRDYLDKLLEVGLINQEQYTTLKRE